MKLLVVDSNSIVNRAFYGIKLLSTKDGLYTNAVQGFFSIMLRLLEDIAPDAVAFAFDLKAPTFRHKLYDGYKAQRKGMPPELAAQLPLVKEALAYLGYTVVESEGFEADDILGTLSAACATQGHSCVLATGDRDSLQLIDESTSVLLATTKVGAATYNIMDETAVEEKYGVTPKALIEVKALMGDSSDNIPGVAGIGEKTALTLIAKYHTLDEVYRQLEGDTLESTPSVKAKLTAGKAQAYLSRELAEICKEATVDTEITHYQKTAGNPDALYALFARLELFNLLKRLGLKPGAAPVGEPPLGDSAPPRPAVKPLALTDDIESLFTAPRLYLLWQEGLLGLSDGTAIASTEDPAVLRKVLALSGEKLTTNSKTLHEFAYKNNIIIQNVIFDGELAGYILNPNGADYALERLGAEHGIYAPGIEGTVPEAHAPLLAQLAMLVPLSQHLLQQLQDRGQTKLLEEIELPLAQVLAIMQTEGFAIDAPGITAYGQELDTEIARLQTEIYAQAGCEFNINSPKQMGEILFEKLQLPVRKKTKSGYSTDAEVLESLSTYHPVVSNILSFRKYAKLKSTYVQGLLNQVCEDGRVRSIFNQTETRTGRISSLEPNLQNIPVRTELGARLRNFFKAAPGKVLVDADYSQIELRVLAHISGDEDMRDAFLSGQDIHTNTAAQVFDLPPLFVTPIMRSRAKAVNFGIVYGIGAFSLAKDIGVTVAEADKYIKNYLKTFGGIKGYMDKTIAEGTANGYVETLFGRRRYLPELTHSNRNIKAFGQRVAMNAPIQGTAADIIKIAMVRVHRMLQEHKLQARLILQVHDELLVECPAAEAPLVSQLLREAMEGAAQLSVPLTVDLGQGTTWQEAH